jgi:deazaflavin-dependent oxidoreductase (nitroreductase family)
MRRVIVIVLSGVVLVGVVRALTSGGSLRDRSRDSVTRWFNPVVLRFGLVGGRRSPWALVEHVGRRSGAVYRTPVLPVATGDFVYIPLPYGETQWARNVRAAGHCRLQRHGVVLELDEPAVVPAGEMLALPAWYRRAFGNRLYSYLRLHVLCQAPGCLDEVLPATGPTAEARPVIA